MSRIYKYLSILNFEYYLYIIFGCIYLIVALNSFGFDDEFYNLNIVENLGIGVTSFTQRDDVHPPLSFYFNSQLIRFLNDWSLVRAVSALFLMMSIIYYTRNVGKGKSEKILLFLLIATSPSLLLWGTSLRWYAYFLPTLFIMLVKPKSQNFTYWLKFIIGSLLLGHIGYIFLLLSPILFLYYLNGYKRPTKLIILHSTVSILLIILFYTPQLVVFYNYHLPNGSNQYDSFLKNLQGVFISIFSNQGLFPITIFGILGAIGVMIMIYSSIINIKKLKNLYHNSFSHFVLGVFLFLISGIASKFRNLVIIEPFKSKWIIDQKKYEKTKKLFIIGFLLIITSNIVGMYNVVNHENTTKNSWNLPISETLKIFNESIDAENTIIVTHDPSLTYILRNEGYSVISTYFREGNTPVNEAKFINVVYLKTFKGSMDITYYDSIIRLIESLEYKTYEVISLRRDSHHAIKKRLDPYYPEYVIQMMVYKGVENIRILNSLDL